MRVVVVGYGMVGSRFVEELTAAVPPGTVQVTVLGAEEYEPYNRVLLSDVVAGTAELGALTLPQAPSDGVQVARGVCAVQVDRDRRVVLTAGGEAVPYDVLVLATGARARMPVADVPGVHALRTLDDAREIVAASVNARRAVVLGGGVLGLEAATGLARRGLDVTVVHPAEHLMDRQLDATAAGALTHALDALGVTLRTGTAADDVVSRDGRLAGLRLADGEVLPADLLVVTAGTVPETDLAAAAGLEVRRGVVVDEAGATADPAVFAVGDCAEPPEGSTGLVAQGWDQARRLARHLAGSGARRASLHGTDVVRVKGLDVVAMGRRDLPGSRRLHLGDPATGRHVEVVVADGVVVGATCVGAPDVGADLTAAYTRRTPVPADPAQLLLRPVRGAAAASEPSPTLMPDRATVCRCNGVTKGDVVACWRHGARSVDDVARATRATTGCGGCAEAVCGLVDWLRQVDPPQATPSGTGDPQPASHRVEEPAPGAVFSTR